MASRNNLSAVLYKAGDMRLEERSISQPSVVEVQVKIQAVGICGSDVNYWRYGKNGNKVVKPPHILGHESSGAVSAVGEGVAQLRIGDRVAIEPAVPCRTCSLCSGGRYNLCRDIKCASSPPTNGTLCRYYVHPADFCHKLPDRTSFEEGAMLEPLSVAVHACRRAGVTVGSNVLICGAGPIGLVSLLTAKASGASKVAITDIAEGRLYKAKELGADYIIKVDPTKDSHDLAKKIVDSMGSADQTIECTGIESSVHAGIYFWKVELLNTSRAKF